ncbi:MAG: hypothetical protein FGF52_00825 [Candidatus Brockarchaeota archaeon]|nr:hypothetical protein [Candidatus Brockarchaeota archaeon]
MSNASSWMRGQLILVMSIILVIVILSAATIIYLTSIHHLFFNYNPSREVVLSIDADFERALTRILANATMQYNKTRTVDLDIDEMKEARTLANKTFSYWFLATQAAYAGRGLNIETEWIDDTIQEEKDIAIRIGWISSQGKSGYINPVQHYPARALEKKLVKLFWYKPNSISAIGSKISIDSVAKGIVGWESTRIILLNLTITSIWGDEKYGLVYVNVVVLREDEEPVNNLKKDGFELYWFDPTIPQGEFWWKRAESSDMVEVRYNGGGNYTLIFKPSFHDPNRQGSFWKWGDAPGYFQFIIVRVKDSRDIIVEAYSYSGVEYLIRENAVEPYYPDEPAKIKETYVFELLPNGTLYWFNTALPVRTETEKPVPPIPIPPVKQLRVYATVNRRINPNDFVEVPYQVEVWDSRYLWPSSTNFLGWRKRFASGAKLVFEVNYPPGCREQAVRVVWLEDCDAEVPNYRIEMKVSGGLARVDTGSYILWIVVDREEASSHFPHVDWSISLRDRFNNSHVEYILTAYDSYLSDAYYIPIKFPEDEWSIVPEPDPETGVVRAPARIVAFRKSDRVVYTSPHPKQGQEVRDELYYEDMIFIPYNVPYFLYSINARWKKRFDIEYSYLVFAGMIGGFPDDRYSSQTIRRFKWGSLLENEATGRVVNGTFNNMNGYIPHRGYAIGRQYGSGAYSYWIALYNESWGTSLFASKQLLDLLDTYGKAYKKDGSEVDQLFVWSRGLGASRFMEYDAIRLEAQGSRYQKTTIDPSKTPKVEFKFAGFLIGGGIADDSSKYDDDGTWYDGGRDYARPFRVLYDPVSGDISDIRLYQRSAFIYDDFSEDPFSTGSFTTPNPASWTPDPDNGWLRSTAPDGSFCVAYSTTRIPAGTRVVHVLAKIRYTTSYINQYAGLTMLDESASNFYLLGFQRYRRSNNYNLRRLGIWRSGQWSGSTSSSSLTLPDNTWLFFLGRRTLTGQYSGRMVIEAYDSQGVLIGTLTHNDQQINVNRVGLGLYDETSDGNRLSADFDFFIACADAEPGTVTVRNLRSGYRVIIRDKYGNIVAQATATSGSVALNVITNPVIKGGSIEIRNSGGTLLFTKTFDLILGGDVYSVVTSNPSVNPVKECNMYYRMFTCRTLENGGVDDMPSIRDINPAY